MTEIRPEIQLISNMVVTNDAGEVLLIKYDADDDRWWLPGDDLQPYQHPDERAKEILNGIHGLQWSGLKLMMIESFRGRQGWHVMFNYRVSGQGIPPEGSAAAWFPQDKLPRTAHGKWEINVVRQVLDPTCEPVGN